MKNNVIAAAILAVGLVLAAFVQSGRYYFVRLDQDTIVRGDRWTGKATRISYRDKRFFEKLSSKDFE